MRLLDPRGVRITVSDELGETLLKQGYRRRDTAPAAPARKPRAPKKPDSAED